MTTRAFSTLRRLSIRGTFLKPRMKMIRLRFRSQRCSFPLQYGQHFRRCVFHPSILTGFFRRTPDLPERPASCVASNCAAWLRPAPSLRVLSGKVLAFATDTFLAAPRCACWPPAKPGQRLRGLLLPGVAPALRSMHYGARAGSIRLPSTLCRCHDGRHKRTPGLAQAPIFTFCGVFSLRRGNSISAGLMRLGLPR